MNVLTFGFFTVVFFGEDMLHISNREIDFIEDTGKVIKKNLRDSLIQIVKDHFQGILHPIAAFAPFVAVNDLCNPYKRNKKNLNIFKVALDVAIKEAKDEKSICNKLLKSPDVNYDEVFIDILGFL